MYIAQIIKELNKTLASPYDMNQEGVLGMNNRNISFISRYNERSLYPLVDNKLITKKLAKEHGIRTSVLIGTVKNPRDISRFLEIIGDYKEFCIKPASGSGGKGIVVIKGKNEENGNFIKPSGMEITTKELQKQLSNITAGLYSLGNRADIALIEELIHVDDLFSDISYEGVPDVRVIVFKGFPIMCMTRLSTAESDGKANLHQGAVGVGLCLRTGRAIRAVQHNKPILNHPDTGINLLEIVMPKWDEILKLASICYEMSGLGYMGTDIVLDKDRGPMVLELNVRPGLAIQICNNAGLLARLRLVNEVSKRKKFTVDERIAFSKGHFGVFKKGFNDAP